MYICRVIFISLLLYSDLYCKKMTHLTAQTVVIMITVVKNKRKKKERKKYISSARFEPRTLSSCSHTLPTGYEGFLEQMM